MPIFPTTLRRLQGSMMNRFRPGDADLEEAGDVPVFGTNPVRDSYGTGGPQGFLAPSVAPTAPGTGTVDPASLIGTLADDIRPARQSLPFQARDSLVPPAGLLPEAQRLTSLSQEILNPRSRQNLFARMRRQALLEMLTRGER